MIDLGILLTQQYRLLSVAALLDVFQTVNTIAVENGCTPYFNITLLHANNVETQIYSALKIDAIQSIKEGTKYDLVLIPAFAAKDIGQAVDANKAYLPWLNNQFLAGAQIASFCTGAFLLGASGLLKGKSATTHIDACGSFAKTFPDVNLLPYKVVTNDNGIFTSGGSISSFHLMLNLINQFCGIEIAVRTAKVFAIDMDRSQQTYFGTFLPSQNHRDKLVAMAQQKIEAAFRSPLSIEDILKDLPSSRRNMLRRFKLTTGFTPIEYLQRLRVESAKKLLEQTNQQMIEIMLNSGYNDVKTFRKIFKRTVGMTPTGYREKLSIG